MEKKIFGVLLILCLSMMLSSCVTPSKMARPPDAGAADHEPASDAAAGRQGSVVQPVTEQSTPEISAAAPEAPEQSHTVPPAQTAAPATVPAAPRAQPQTQSSSASGTPPQAPPAGRAPSGPAAALPVPRVIVSTLQETFYNGSPQAIQARCEQQIPLIITYYPNAEDYRKIRNEFYNPPSEPGTYFVSVNCARGYGYADINDILVEYRIKKGIVRITADRVQSAVYNGNPRRVQAAADPAVPLSYSYYPNIEVMKTAVEAFVRPDNQQTLSSVLQRFKRVESAPTEQGVYYVLIYFNGNDRYEPVYSEVEFTINPAARRN